MANEWILKDYRGGAVPTTLASDISGSATSISVASGSSLPDGSAGPFVMVIDRGGTEEKILVSSRSGNTLSVLERGYDGTANVAHLAAVAMEHCIDAHTFKQANALAAAMESQGSMAFRSSGDSYIELGVGVTGLPIVSNGATPEYATLGVNSVSVALIELLSPAGAISATCAAVADTGHLLLEGQSIVGANVTYPYLWAKVPTAWKSGTTLVLPDVRGRLLFMQDGSSLVRGLVGGSNALTLNTTNMPPHAHTADHGHPSATVTVNDNLVDRPTRLTSGAAGTFIAGLDVNGDGVADAGYSGMVMNYETEHGHTSSVSVPSTGVNTSSAGGTAGVAVPLDIRPAFLAINYQIKAH